MQRMRRRTLGLLVLAAACTSAPAPSPTPVPKPETTDVEAAKPDVDPAILGAITQLKAAVEKTPDHVVYLYLLAWYHDRAHQSDDVVQRLRQLDALGWDRGLAPDQFENTRTPAFQEIAATLHARVPLVQRAREAFTITGQRDVIPEGIAWDPVDNVIYVSSIARRKVLRIDRQGRATDFTTEGQDGLEGGLGIKVDADRRMLWVIGTSTPEIKGYVPGSDRSALHAYDLRTGALVRKIEATPGLLNDLTLLRDGSLFATDMGRGHVLRLAPGASMFEIWAEGFRFPNGIAISEDERTLYVADFSAGITRFDELDPKKRAKIESKALLNGIDGLSFDRGALIGIQNSLGRPRVIRIDPATGDVAILESKNAKFEIPTTGVVIGKEYWFIANPGLRKKTHDEDLVMLKIPL
jgi:sugar lactone lactonase YvrE